MRNSVVKAAVAALVLAVLTSGCGGQSSQTEAPLKGKSLNVVTTFGPNDGGHEAFVALCGEFAAATGAEINDGSADSTEEWKQSVLASYENGSEPDVLFFFTGPDVEPLIKENKFVPLDEISDKYPDYSSNINLSVLESLKASDGKSYAVPVKGYWERLFVNKDIFVELDLPLPENYDDLFDLAPQLLEAGYTPIAASLNEVPHYLFEALLFNQTGPAVHRTIPDDPANPPESWVLAMEQFTAMYSAGMFPPDTGTITHAEALEQFQSKQAAMIIDGDWTAPYIRDTENVIVINFPDTPDGPRKDTDLISGFSMGFYISRKAWDDPDKRDAAAAFVEFITSNDSIKQLNVSGAAMPISASGNEADDEDNADVSPLRRSIDALNEQTTAFVGAAADEVPLEARSWLFARILPLAKGELNARELISEFIELNNGLK